MDIEAQIGEEQVGSYARWQLEAARSDPRLDRTEPVLGDDFRHSIEEAQRTRELGYLGLRELAGCYERERDRLEVSSAGTELNTWQRSKLQGYWERSEMAKAELENDAPHLNALALISILSALDALVEGMPTALVNVLTNISLDRFMDGLPDKAKAEFSAFPEPTQRGIKRVVEKRFRNMHALAKQKRTYGAGVGRYENVLKQVGLQQAETSPIPASLNEALQEAHAIRNVLVHRGGRVDEPAKTAAPTLEFQVGHFIRLGGRDYLRFWAAVTTYGYLVIGRLFGPYAPDVDLEDWERNHPTANVYPDPPT